MGGTPGKDSREKPQDTGKGTVLLCPLSITGTKSPGEQGHCLSTSALVGTAHTGLNVIAAESVGLATFRLSVHFSSVPPRKSDPAHQLM
jgi:hypothetical protein